MPRADVSTRRDFFPTAPPGRPFPRAKCGAARARVFQPAPASSSGDVRREQKQFRVLAGARQRTFARAECSRGVRRTTLSRTTCALMPPKPIALTLARSGRSRGQSSASRNTRKRGRRPGELRVRLLAAGRRRQHLRVDGHRGLDQTGDAGGGLGVADVGLDRADGRGRRIGFSPRAARAKELQVPWRRRRRCRCRGLRSKTTVSMPKPARR